MRLIFLVLLFTIKVNLSFAQGTNPYLINDTLLCWDKEGSKKMYEYAVKSIYCDSINAVNNSIILDYKELYNDKCQEVKVIKTNQKYFFFVTFILAIFIGNRL
jgi:hypothetical protein